MDFKDHLKTAWENTLQYIMPVIILTLVQLIVVTLSFGILAPVTTAGYIQSLLLTVREGREPKVGDLFSEMRLFFPLLAFGILATLATTLGFMLLILPGVLIITFLVFATSYMMPLMTDRKMSLIAAIKGSWDMAVEKPLGDQLLLVLFYLIIMSVGGAIPLALLVAQPMAVFLLVSVYEERFQAKHLRIEKGV